MAASDAFYLEVLTEVNEVINELGTTYSVRGIGVYDPNELEAVPVAPRVVTGLIADQTVTNSFATNYGAPLAAGASWIGRKNLILRADANPQPNEEVLVDGKWYPLSNNNPIQPADILLLYILDVTR